MYLPIFDALLGLFGLAADSAAKQQAGQELSASLLELNQELSEMLLSEGLKAALSPKFHNASSALFCQARLHQRPNLEHLARQLELFLQAMSMGKANRAHATQLQALVKSQLASMS